MSLPKADNSEIPPPQPPATTFSTPPLLIAITLSTVVVCFVGFSVVYLCRCCFMNIIHTWAFQSSASGTVIRLSPNASPYRGLDPSLLQTFPTFLYATIKDHRKEKKYSLECAICLLEFEDDSMLRLLTICFHVFHQECIDLWLRSRKTCPVCRRDLDLPSHETRKSQELAEDNEEESMDHVCIDVKEGDSDGEHGEPKFLRSHSTGHSIVMIREGDEGRDDNKYRLRLVEHVALKIVKGGHNHSKSCSSYKDMARHCSNCGYVQTVFGSSSRGGIENI